MERGLSGQAPPSHFLFLSRIFLRTLHRAGSSPVLQMKTRLTEMKRVGNKAGGWEPSPQQPPNPVSHVTVPPCSRPPQSFEYMSTYSLRHFDAIANCHLDIRGNKGSMISNSTIFLIDYRTVLFLSLQRPWDFLALEPGAWPEASVHQSGHKPEKTQPQCEGF